MTIGNAATATRLYNHYKGEMNERIRAPKGYNRIGMGCYRMAILEKSTSTVYKIGNSDANLSEAANARRLMRKSTRGLKIDLRIPQTRTYRMPVKIVRGYRHDQNVVAQEFAGKAMYTQCESMNFWWEDQPKCTCKRFSPVCFREVHEIIGEFTCLDDIHSGNVLMDRDQVFWVIDLAA